MNPWDALADAFEPEEGDPAVNVYPAWAEQIVSPAIVVMPDDPWVSTSAYGWDQERYTAVAAVSASTPGDGLALLHSIVHYIIRRAMTVEGISWEDVSAPVTSEATGTPFLAARVRLTYRNCTHDEES